MSRYETNIVIRKLRLFSASCSQWLSRLMFTHHFFLLFFYINRMSLRSRSEHENRLRNRRKSIPNVLSFNYCLLSVTSSLSRGWNLSKFQLRWGENSWVESPCGETKFGSHSGNESWEGELINFGIIHVRKGDRREEGESKRENIQLQERPKSDFLRMCG